MSYKLFDTHTHLTDNRFDGDRGALISQLARARVMRVLDIACDIREAEKTLELSDSYGFIYAGVGQHPHEARYMSMELMDALKSYAAHKKVVALGEMGLDYHYDFSPREQQKKWFALQLDLAQQLDMPVILHIREAFGDCMDILRAHKQNLRGVMHCFSGSYEIARECMDLGLYIAFGGAVTFKNAARLADVAARLPSDRILAETDCPYMTPEPYRGKRCEPAHVMYTVQRIAQLRGVTFDEMANITYENGMNLFFSDICV